MLYETRARRPPPRSAFRILPPHVELVVLKALEKRPEMRFPTMEEMMRAMADPVGYVESHGGVGQFLQVQLMPSTAPVPMRMTPASFTPVPGSVVHPSNYGNTPPSGIHYGAAAAPTTLGASAGEVQPKRGKAGFIIAGVLVVAAAGAGIAIVMTGKDVPAN